MDDPDLTFVIAAYNAEDTLSAAIQSLQSQTLQNWRAVIVDDGSSDGTFDLASRHAAEDTRIRVHRQANAGASAARNKAVDLAATDYICMLDADDWIDRYFLEVMLPIAVRGRGSAIPYCTYRRVKESGKFLPVEPLPQLAGAAAKARFSEYCAIAIHSAIMPRNLYLSVGGMTVGRRTCEDWELWIRVAFSDVRFIPVNKCLSFYRGREGSLTSNQLCLMRDAVEVITVADTLWAKYFSSCIGPAVPARMSPAMSQMKVMAWAAGLSAGQDVTPDELLSIIPTVPDIIGYEAEIAASLIYGLSVRFEVDEMAELLDRREEWMGRAADTFAALERVGRSGVQRILWTHLARTFASFVSKSDSWQAGPVTVIGVDLSDFGSVKRPEGADSVILSVNRGKFHLGAIEIPVFTELASAEVLNALQTTWGWRKRLQAQRLRDLPTFSAALIGSAFRNGLRAARILKISGSRSQRFRAWLNKVCTDAQSGATSSFFQCNTSDAEVVSTIVAHETGSVGSNLLISAEPNQLAGAEPDPNEDRVSYWEQIFDKTDPWNYLSDYEQVKYQQTLDLLPSAPIPTALEIACAEGIFTQRLSERVDHLIAVDISTRALERARARCVTRTNIEFRQLDIVVDSLPKGLDVIVCSEMLYYMENKRQLRMLAEKISAALKPGGCFLTAHARLIADEPHRTGFDWDNPFGDRTIQEAFSEVPGLIREETIETELYAVHRFRKAEGSSLSSTQLRVRLLDYGKPLDAKVEKCIVWGGSIVRRSEAVKYERSSVIPVLMYHRIASTGPAALARYRTTPDAFDRQLKILRRLGYYSIDSETLYAAYESNRPLKGRPVLITFDDAYIDFMETAHPLLLCNDFFAEVFVVTDKVGCASDWDSRYGEPTPLMTWQHIRALHGEGVRFGSHLATHIPAPYLTSEGLLTEAVRSRLTLERELGVSVRSISLPYGIYDDRAIPILQLSGYSIGYSTEHRLADPTAALLKIPRLEIHGGLSDEQFNAMLPKH